MPTLLRRVRSFLAFAAILAGALTTTSAIAASEAIKLEVDFFEHGSAEPMNHATVWISGRRLRVEQQTPGYVTKGPVLIYRGDRDSMLSVSERKRSYARVERQTLTLLGNRARSARGEVEGQLQHLPADQRRGFERLLGVSRADPARHADPIVVTRDERSTSVAGFACTGVVLSRSDRLLGEACVASWESVGMTRADIELFRMLGNFQRDAMGTRGLTPMELVPNQPLELISQFDGLPLSFRRLVDGRERSAIRVSSIQRVPSDDALFEAPQGYALRRGVGAFLEHVAATVPKASGAVDSSPRDSPGAASPIRKQKAAASPSRIHRRHRSIRLFPESD